MNTLFANLFTNYQNIKMDVLSPDLVNVTLMVLFFALSFATARKTQPAPPSNAFMSYHQTEQMKGIAIFFVMLGHLWVHVSKAKPGIILSGDAVAMFLILSGFGLMISTRTERIEIKKFAAKRMRNISIAWRVSDKIQSHYEKHIG